MPVTISLPIVALDETHFLASQEARWRLVRKAGGDLPEPPEGSPWLDSPLTLWCWFVLKANDLDVDPDVHEPLCNWGIDLTFASDKVRRFVWTVA